MWEFRSISNISKHFLFNKYFDLRLDHNFWFCNSCIVIIFSSFNLKKSKLWWRAVTKPNLCTNFKLSLCSTFRSIVECWVAHQFTYTNYFNTSLFVYFFNSNQIICIDYVNWFCYYLNIYVNVSIFISISY